MKHFNLLILALTLLCAKTQVFAAPHLLENNFHSSKYYVIDTLVKKEKVTIYVDKAADEDMSVYYQKFFQNILRYIGDSAAHKEELKSILDIIEFAASKEAYNVITDETQQNSADIKFFFDKPSLSRGLGPCPRGAAACFIESRKAIFLPLPQLTVNSPFGSFEYLALHEIGHSLRLEDTYDKEMPIKSGRYGSAAKDSIMKDSRRLTCDDADAIVNITWLTLKHFNENLPDLTFTSFCNSTIKFRNAQQMGRSPLTINKDGERMVYSYCKTGEVKTTTYINPVNGNNFYKFTEERPDCEGHLPKMHEPIPEEGFNYTIKDFFTKETIKDERVNTLLAHNTYMALPYSGGLTLSIAENKYGIPAYIAITNEKNVLIYLLAYLKEGYNIVYDFNLNGGNETINLNGSMFIYNRQDNSQIYAYVAPDREKEADRNNPLRKVLESYYSRLAKSHTIPLPHWGGLGMKFPAEHIKEAQAWEKTLLDYTPLLKNKDMLKEIKAISMDTNPKLKISLENMKKYKF